MDIFFGGYLTLRMRIKMYHDKNANSLSLANIMQQFEKLQQFTTNMEASSRQEALFLEAILIVLFRNERIFRIPTRRHEKRKY